MLSLLESFYDTMDELHVDFCRRLEDIEQEAWSAPVLSTPDESGHDPQEDRFEEIRYPLGLRQFWTDDRLAPEPVEGLEQKGLEKKGFSGPSHPHR
ncbi:hypothetical protein ACIOEZ_23530 [Streptomyces sp. NPDC087866]|uniref:hypothetical protein n=1 Tax=unclassified Streptomyces TaxID=2593676 RepID=UPI0022554407|nr:hypothetical protein [Streptomyces sp. NBC_01789]MCX4450380.1 hypothetical protein [Streptomyces sp. NBC_01789]